MTDNFGPEIYAPPNHRSAKKESAPDQSVLDPIEGQIRQFVRHKLSLVQRQGSETGGSENSINASVNALLRHLAADTFDEIDRVIRDLENVRDMLRKEGERVERLVAGYARLNHAAMKATKVISDSLRQWKGDPNQKPESSLDSD